MSQSITFDAAPTCDTPDRCLFAMEGPMQQEADWRPLYNRQGVLTNPRKNAVSVRCTICGRTFVQELRTAPAYVPPAPAVPPPMPR